MTTRNIVPRSANGSKNECKVSRGRTSAPLKAHEALKNKGEYNDEPKECYRPDCDYHLLRRLRLRQLLLRMPQRRVPLPIDELQVRLPQ